MRVYRIEHARCGVGPYQAADRMYVENANACNDCICGEYGDPDACECQPYSEDDIADAMAVCGRAYGSAIHSPPPSSDNMNFNGNRHSAYAFGFRSIEQMLEWFEADFIEYAKEKDFVVREYRIRKDQVIFGDSQVAFRKPSAKVVSTTPAPPMVLF